MKKSILVITFLLIAISFTACGDKKSSDNKNQSNNNISSSTTPKIEVVVNKNEYAKKVNKNTMNNQKNSANKKSFYYDYDIKSDYDLRAQPANKDAEVSVRPRTKIDAYTHIRSPYERVQVSLLSKQLSPTFRLKCSACHDDYANGVLGPSLLGRDVEYIYNKIIAFKTGKKKNVFMKDLIHNMTDEEIHSVAQDIYKFNLEVQKIRNKK